MHHHKKMIPKRKMDSTMTSSTQDSPSAVTDIASPLTGFVRVWCTVQLYSIINITSIMPLQDIFL